VIRPSVKILSLSAVCTLLIVAVYLTLSGHFRQQALESSVLPGPISIAASAQRRGDRATGRERLLSADYVSCGLPARVWRQINTDDPALRLTGRSGLAAALPYFNNLVTDKNGVELVTGNCLICHAAPLFGEIVVGLGNEFLDFTGRENAIQQAGLLVRGDAETTAWNKLSRRIDAVSPYTRASTIGANVANNLAYALMTFIDPVSLDWSDQPLLELPDEYVLPVSVPPWWRMAKKNALFYQGQAQGDHARSMMLAALLCTENTAEVKEIDTYAPHILAYIESLEPPVYPFPIVPSLATQGEKIFIDNCVRCHGTYGESGVYPNLLVPLQTIGTDPALALQAVEYRRYANWFEQSAYGQGTSSNPVQGYMAPPLDGIWATGPFLHNGSVPTLAQVLNSSQRPRWWRHTKDRKFDQSAVGWQWETLSAGKTGKPAADAWIYDTTLTGYGNQGHVFGDHLSEAQRSAVLEYLKTL